MSSSARVRITEEMRQATFDAAMRYLGGLEDDSDDQNAATELADEILAALEPALSALVAEWEDLAREEIEIAICMARDRWDGRSEDGMTAPYQRGMSAAALIVDRLRRRKTSE